MIDFTNVKAITIPEGAVKKITRKSNGVTLWEGVSFVNQIPLSTDASGNVYNGVGYAAKIYLNSSGVETTIPASSITVILTGFIKLNHGDVVRLKNCYMVGEESKVTTAKYGKDAWSLGIGIYDQYTKAWNFKFPWAQLFTEPRFNCQNDGDGVVTTLTVADKNTRNYRFCLAVTGNPADAILTINQPIE